VLQQPAQPLVAADVAKRERCVIRWFVQSLCCSAQQLVPHPLMRAFLEIVIPIRSCYAVQMPRAEEHEVSQTLAAQRANESLDKRLAIGCHPGAADHFSPFSGQFLVEGVRKLGIAVMLDVTNPQTTVASLFDKRMLAA